MLLRNNDLTAIRSLCLLVGMLSVTMCQASDYNNYLRQMETEAKRLAATLHTNEASSESAAVVPNSVTSGMASTRERLPLGLQQDAFEAILRQEFLGTYTFYQKLSADDRLRVFKRYQQDNRISTIREETLDLL